MSGLEKYDHDYNSGIKVMRIITSFLAEIKVSSLIRNIWLIFIKMAKGPMAWEFFGHVEEHTTIILLT